MFDTVAPLLISADHASITGTPTEKSTVEMSTPFTSGTADLFLMSFSHSDDIAYRKILATIEHWN